GRRARSAAGPIYKSRRVLPYRVREAPSYRQHRGGGAKAAIVVDHAEAADQRMAGACDLSPFGLTVELPNRFDQAEETAGRAGLAAGELAATGVVRQVATGPEFVASDEVRAVALGAE